MIEELTEAEVASLDNGKCPDCEGTRFMKGPHGGLCVNIMCAGCGAKFNVVPGLVGAFGKQRIGRPKTPKWLVQLLTECSITVLGIYWPGFKWGFGVCIIRQLRKGKNEDNLEVRNQPGQRTGHTGRRGSADCADAR